MTEIDNTEETSPFEAMRQVDEHGQEFWSARDLQPWMGYTEWRNLQTAIDRAKTALINTGNALTSHVVDASKSIPRPQGGSIKKADFKLSRHAAYLVAINGDPEKPEIAAAQGYFAMQTMIAEQVQAKTPQTYLEAVKELIAAVEARELAADKARALEKSNRPML